MEQFNIKKGDTCPAIATTLTYANGSAVDLSNGSVVFCMGNLDYSPYQSGMCVITGSTDGMCEYRWTSGNTGSTGKYWGEFKCIWGGSIMTLPSDHSLLINIFEDYE